MKNFMENISESKGSKNYSYNHEEYKKFKEDLKSKIPIRKGCVNETCFCTGDCNKIIGYQNPLTHEIEYLKENSLENQEDWLS